MHTPNGARQVEELEMSSKSIDPKTAAGWVVVLAIAVAVFASAGSYASPDAFIEGFAPAIVVAAALSLAGAVEARG
jgi:hypothetical protein